EGVLVALPERLDGELLEPRRGVVDHDLAHRDHRRLGALEQARDQLAHGQRGADGQQPGERAPPPAHTARAGSIGTGGPGSLVEGRRHGRTPPLRSRADHGDGCERRVKRGTRRVTRATGSGNLGRWPNSSPTSTPPWCPPAPTTRPRP